MLGIFTSAEPAHAACKAAGEWQAKNWSGQHSFEVFEVAELDVAAPIEAAV